MQNKVETMIIGLGYHARRIYHPIIKKLEKELNSNISTIVDLKSEKTVIETYLSNIGYNDVYDILYLEPKEAGKETIPQETILKLDNLVKKNSISTVIISTEPLSHMGYALWALDRGLNVLMDKPISTKEKVISNIEAAKSLYLDYLKLEKTYKDTRGRFPDQIFSLMVQRRYHPAYNRIKEAINEVFQETECPVTFIDAMHSDGQWRTPVEIVEQDYHPYNSGYGVFSHSGYHILDIVLDTIYSATTEETQPDSAEVFSSCTQPLDFLTHVNLDTHAKMLNNFNKYNKYDMEDYKTLMQNYGELDAVTHVRFKKGGRINTLANINMIHNGISQRHWATAHGRDLYKGNGRIRQEYYYIVQGPFQSILFNSFQNKEVTPQITDDHILNKYGGENHLDIHIFKNEKVNNKWQNYEFIQVKDIYKKALEGDIRGHNEEARSSAIKEFYDLINKNIPLGEAKSLLHTHKKSTQLLSCIYQSIIYLNELKDPIIRLDFETSNHGKNEDSK